MPPHSTATKTQLKTPHWIQQQKQYRKDDKCDYQKQEWHKGGVSLSQSIQLMHHNRDRCQPHFHSYYTQVLELKVQRTHLKLNI